MHAVLCLGSTVYTNRQHAFIFRFIAKSFPELWGGVIQKIVQGQQHIKCEQCYHTGFAEAVLLYYLGDIVA